jgi:pycsar effector protein
MADTLDIRTRVEMATKTLERTLSFFPRVDARAQVLLGIDVAMLFALALNTPPFLGPWWLDAAYLVAVVLLGFSLFKLYRVFFPQLSGGPASLIYFNSIRQLPEKEFVDRFTVQTEQKYLDDVLNQVWRNSEIVANKFNNLREAMLCASAALPFWLFELAFAAVTKGVVTLK